MSVKSSQDNCKKNRRHELFQIRLGRPTINIGKCSECLEASQIRGAYTMRSGRLPATGGDSLPF
jgi:hypothetical protein